MSKLEIDWKSANNITYLTLVDWRKYLKKELKQWKKNPKTDSNPDGYWLHPEDVANNIKYIAALDLIIPAFEDPTL